MPKRDTKTMEELHDHLAKARAIVRNEIEKNGASFDNIFHALTPCEEQIAARLREIEEFNKTQSVETESQVEKEDHEESKSKPALSHAKKK